MVELLEPEENITPEDEQFWGSLLDKVKKEEKGEQSHLLEVSVLCNQYMKTISKMSKLSSSQVVRSNADKTISQVAPVPGFCVKTKDKEGTKVFLNICTTDKIPEPKLVLLSHTFYLFI